jgi:acyl-CoA thioesterase FadM
LFRRRLSLIDENVLQLRVLPNDVDVTRLSSDRYLPLMDLGRINTVLRAGLLRALLRNRWIPLARVVTLRFRHPLKMFQKFELRLRALYWDHQWVWTEHRFERRSAPRRPA